MHNMFLYLKLLIYLPGTLLHETAHYISALFFATSVHRFTIIPDFENKTSGSVEFTPRNGAGLAIISAFPKLWWIALYWLLTSKGILVISGFDPSLDIQFNYDYFTGDGENKLFVTYEVISRKFLSSAYV